MESPYPHGTPYSSPHSQCKSAMKRCESRGGLRSVANKRLFGALGVGRCHACAGVGERMCRTCALYYDDYRADYHPWNDGEMHAYRVWLVERHYEYRDFNRLSREDQRVLALETRSSRPILITSAKIRFQETELADNATEGAGSGSIETLGHAPCEPGFASGGNGFAHRVSH